MPLTLLAFALLSADPEPISFRHDILPVLSRAGCNLAACHGGVGGKGSFHLSLRGSDPEADYRTLSREGFGRRIDPTNPGHSLLLRKGLGRVPHDGGTALAVGSAAARLLEAWIAQGLPDDPKSLPGLSRLEVSGAKDGVRAQATFADGRQRDVTGLARFISSEPDLATVDSEGRVTFQRTGEVAISMHYLGQRGVVRLTHVVPVKDFVWNAPAESNFVDTHTFAKLRRLQLPPAETCSDAVFLRRVLLDLCARLPSPVELRQFLADPAPDKRSRLIDRLLAEADFADFWALQWHDHLGTKDNRVRLRSHLAQNTRFDVVARELIVADSFTSKVPYETANRVGRALLGVRIDCARCHDHPHADWTRLDHANLTAFFEPKMNRREEFADWLTARDNPYFARTIVNVVWSRLLGRGIVDPVDDFRATNPSANDELLAALTKDFVAHDYDLKHLIRTIVTSRTYQASSATHPASKDDRRYFAGAYPKRLTSEQLADALAQVTEVADVVPQRPAGTRAIDAPRDYGRAVFGFSQPARISVCEAEPEEASIAAVLHLLNNDDVQKKITHPKNRIARLLANKTSDRQLAEEIFLAALSRPATEKELGQVFTHVQMAGNRTSWEDILWALINTKEFLFRG